MMILLCVLIGFGLGWWGFHHFTKIPDSPACPHLHAEMFETYFFCPECGKTGEILGLDDAGLRAHSAKGLGKALPFHPKDPQ